MGRRRDGKAGPASSEGTHDTGEGYCPGWLQSVDRRYAPARLIAAQLVELQEALGGPDLLSPQQKALTERVVWLNVRLQQDRDTSTCPVKD